MVEEDKSKFEVLTEEVEVCEERGSRKRSDGVKLLDLLETLGILYIV